MTRHKRRKGATAKEPPAPPVHVRGPVVALLRVSTDEQKVQSQKLVVQRFLDRERVPAAEVDWVEEPDGTSGLAIHRPHLEGILLAARAGRVRTLVASEVSRIGRLTGRTVMLLDELHNLGVRIVFEGHGIDYSTEGGRMVARLLAVIAQGEAERLNLRTRAGMEAAKRGRTRSGRPVGRPRYLFGEAEASRLRELRAAGKTWDAIAAEGFPLVQEGGEARPASAWALRTRFEAWEKSSRTLDVEVASVIPSSA